MRDEHVDINRIGAMILRYTHGYVTQTHGLIHYFGDDVLHRLLYVASGPVMG